MMRLKNNLKFLTTHTQKFSLFTKLFQLKQNQLTLNEPYSYSVPQPYTLYYKTHEKKRTKVIDCHKIRKKHFCGYK